jgi:hypothetical protein
MRLSLTTDYWLLTTLNSPLRHPPYAKAYSGHVTTNLRHGNGKLSWWLIGLVTTMVLGAAGTTMRSVQNDGERIAVLESQVRDTREELKAINLKLDKLLDHRRP